MKNIIIVILLLAVVGLGFFVLKGQGITSVKELASSVEKTVGETVNSVKNEVSSTLAPSTEKVSPTLVGLPGDTAFSLVLPAKAFTAAVTHLSGFLVKVKSSSLGKKLEVDKMIEQAMAAAESGATSMGNSNSNFGGGDFGDDKFGSGEFGSGEFGSGEMNGQDFGDPNQMGQGAAAMPATSSQPSLQEVLKVLENFERLEVQVRAKTLEGKATPLLKINASFKDDTYSKQLQGLLDGFVAMAQESGQGEQLAKDVKDTEAYVLNVKPPMTPVEVIGRVKPSGKDISATIGIIAGPASAPSTGKVEASSADSVIARSAVNKDSLSTYMNISNFRSIIDVVFALIPGDESKAQIEMARKALDSTLGNYGAFALSSIFEKGFNSKSCSRFNAEGAGFTPFKAAIDSGDAAKSKFYKLIGPRTTFAFRIDGAVAGAFIQSMSGSLGAQGALSADPQMAAATTEMLAQAKVAEEEFKKLKIKDVGLVTNAPTTSFIPSVGVYLEHEEGLSIDQFGNTLKSLFTKLAPPSISAENPITISKDASGQTLVSFPAIEGQQLVFRSISSTQIFGTIEESFAEEAKTMLAAPEAYVDDAKLQGKGVDLSIVNNDSFYYLSTSSLMPLVRQFTPFITMSKPELKISDSELTQFLDLLDFNLLVTGRNTSPENLMLCSEGRAIVY